MFRNRSQPLAIDEYLSLWIYRMCYCKWQWKMFYIYHFHRAFNQPGSYLFQPTSNHQMISGSCLSILYVVTKNFMRIFVGPRSTQQKVFVTSKIGWGTDNYVTGCVKRDLIRSLPDCMYLATHNLDEWIWCHPEICLHVNTYHLAK